MTDSVKNEVSEITNKSKKDEIFAAYMKSQVRLQKAEEIFKSQREELNNAKTIHAAFDTIAEYFDETIYVYDADKGEKAINALAYARSQVINGLCYSLNLKLNDAIIKQADQAKQVRSKYQQRNSAYGEAPYQAALKWKRRVDLTFLSIKETLEAAEEAHQKWLERPYKRTLPKFEESPSVQREAEKLSEQDAIAQALEVGVDVSDLIPTEVQLNTDGVHTSEDDQIDIDSGDLKVGIQTDSDPVLGQIAADGLNVKVA